ncbi:MAG: hypothetical protein JWM27_3910 [Gemmatimonadetes bacterium]|nr:hypothetical protein [Gemmatimonadota bacterium]
MPHRPFSTGVLALLVALLCVARPAAAQAGACSAARGTPALRECGTADVRRADAELNRVYGRLSGKLDAGRRRLLLEAQRAWLRYRDAQCRFAASESTGGTLEAIERLDCLATVTRARIHDLRAELYSGR